MSRLKKSEWLFFFEARHQLRPNRSPAAASALLSQTSQSLADKKLEVTYQIVKEQS
jgi:hypothetical protein